MADTAMTPEVVQAASTLTVRHLVLFMVIGQPDLHRAAGERPADVAGMYHAAAAQEVVHRRDVLLAQAEIARRARDRSQHASVARAGQRLPGDQAEK